MLDESVAFDMLAILMVKLMHGLPAKAEYEATDAQIRKALGDALMRKVLDSSEYENLVHVNGVVFDCVEKARHNEITAKEVDEANHLRYHLKKALQTKFWPQSPLRETKTDR